MRRVVPLVLVVLGASYSGCNTDWVKQRYDDYRKQSSELDAQTIAAGLKQALELGSEHATSTLGKVDGYLKDPQVHIAAPSQLRKAEDLLRRVGAGKYADQFVTSLNRAAEAAAPKAKPIFLDVLHSMTVDDAVDILKGPDDAATQYFRRHSQDRLTARFRPMVAHATREVAVTAYYSRFVDKAGRMGLVDTRDLDLDDYVTRKALDGLFYMTAQEEKRIRRDPVARITELLREVFGS